MDTFAHSFDVGGVRLARPFRIRRLGHFGVYRNHETLEPVSYYQKLPPDVASTEVLLIDPMLATGGSAVAAMDLLKELGATTRHVRLVNLIAAPEGIRRVRLDYPSLPIFTAAIDKKLNHKGYILPGLGDAGDRPHPPPEQLSRRRFPFRGGPAGARGRHRVRPVSRPRRGLDGRIVAARFHQARRGRAQARGRGAGTGSPCDPRNGRRGWVAGRALAGWCRVKVPRCPATGPQAAERGFL